MVYTYIVIFKGVYYILYKIYNIIILYIMNIPLYIKHHISTHGLGYAATFLGIISFIPILYTILITKNTSNFTYKNLALALLSNILWFYYGYNTSAYAPLISGVLFFFVYSFILYYKLFF